MSIGSEQWYDPSTGTIILNDSAVPVADIQAALHSQHPEVASIVRWGQGLQRSGSLFDRDKYLTPRNPFEQMKVAYEACQQDDVVTGVLETGEALTFGSVDFDADDEDEENIWQQICEDIDLDERMREMWRELFTVSQFYAVTWWGQKDYKVKGKDPKSKTKRKKAYAGLKVPVGITLLDPLKVVPVGNLLFGQESLAYISNRTESAAIDEVLAGKNTTDRFVDEIIVSKYEPNDRDRQLLIDLDINPEFLYLLNSERVWRVTETSPAYERFATIRMKSVFELLDLKRQLREMDRAHLIGSTNFIVLVKKGTDEFPARPNEINALAAQVRSSARLPVIVGDHRLEVEIITPKTDNTLDPARYNGIDARIEARLFGMFMTGNFAAGAKGDDSIKLARVVAKSLESRRDRLMKEIVKHVIKPTQEKNKDKLKADDVDIQFHPRRIALDFDPSLATLLQDLRDRGDLSRETILEEVGLDQGVEAQRREREKDNGYDDIFKPTNVPFDSPLKGADTPGAPMNPAQQKAAGRAGGGNSGGGGANPDSKTANSSPVRPRKGNSS